MRPLYQPRANQQRSVETTPEVATINPTTQVPANRELVLLWGFLFLMLVLWGRFFYLQIIRGEVYDLVTRQQVVANIGRRGKIFSADGFLLVSNHYTYQVYLNVGKLQDAATTYDQLAPLILADSEASSTLRPKDDFLTSVARVQEKLAGRGNLMLAKNVAQETMDAINNLKLSGIEPDRELVRYYPEKTMAAQTLGFLSKDNQVGRYGIEGGRNKELTSKTRQSLSDVDRLGRPIYLNPNLLEENLNGRDLYLTIRRDLQVLAEDTLAQDLAKFGAQRGEIIIMEPSTGKILALATNPSYDPGDYNNYPTSLYKNPAIVDLFEPGSTFKVLTMAAAIDSGMVSPDTKCPNCGGPRTIAGHQIRTWNLSYNPGITMTQALEKSDNTAMVYVSDQLGSARFQQYLQDFGIGEPLNLEVEEDLNTSFPEVWGPLETATRAFGQGVSVSSMQLMRAVGAIANGGKLMQPFLVEKSDDHTGEIYYTQPQEIRQVISAQSAATMQKMMQAAAQHGEAQYIYKNTSLIAGKTGTAQIPIPGGYSEETIASFIGFAPYDNPKFLMLVKYEKPKSSIYAAETAALTWNQLAEKLMVIFNIASE